MAVSSARPKHVNIRRISRKSLKRRSKNAKHRKHTNKSIQIARSLITPTLLKQSARVTDVSIDRNRTISVKKIAKHKHQTKQTISEIDTSQQQEISDKKTQHNDIQLLKQSQTNHSNNNDQILDTTEQLHSTQHNHHGVTVSKLSSPNSTINKIVHTISHKSSSESVSESNRKDINVSHDTTSKLTPSSANKGFSTLTRSNKISSVHRDNGQLDQVLSKSKEKQSISPYMIALCGILCCLITIGIILAIVIPLLTNRSKTTTTSTTTISTIVSTPVCTTGNYTACSTTMFHYFNSGYNSPGSWISVSCCFVAPTMNQTRIEFAMQDDTGGGWMIDDVNATQGNGELISNGGFEINILPWTLIVYSNITSLTTVDSISGNQHKDAAFLYGLSVNGPDYVKQTFSIIQGENILISFWWNYIPALGAASGISELTVTLT